jgi:hypothetical protein
MTIKEKVPHLGGALEGQADAPRPSAGRLLRQNWPSAASGCRREGNQMFDTKKVEIQWGDQTLTLETGRVARQADGAVLATLGETVVLCAVTAARTVKSGQDFFPLTVHYQEKFSGRRAASRAASSSVSAAPPKRRRSPAVSSTARSARSSRRASTTRSTSSLTC